MTDSMTPLEGNTSLPEASGQASAAIRQPAGVYVLANDAVLPWTTSFVASFRRFNPDLPLCLIPFDDRCDSVARLVGAAGGSILRRPEEFSRLERIGESLELGLSAYGRHWFRRFAAFAGTFERFLYLDTRVVVLGPLEPIIAEVVPDVCDVVHFDRMINEVYREGAIRRGFVLAGRGHAFNSGMWASRAELFTLEQMEAAGTALVAVREQMNQRNTDQFFLNYLCDEHAVRVAHFADLHEDFTHACWAGDGGEIYTDESGVWRRWKFGSGANRKKIPFVHWAGFRLSPAMPHFHLFDRFQTPHYGLPRRILGWSRGVPGRLFARLRGNRHLNALYHRCRSAL